MKRASLTGSLAPTPATPMQGRAFCEVPNPSRRQAWALCTHDP